MKNNEIRSSDIVVYTGHIAVVGRKYDGKHWDTVLSKDACAIMYGLLNNTEFRLEKQS